MSYKTIPHTFLVQERNSNKGQYTIVPVPMNFEGIELPFIRVIQIRKMDTGCLSYVVMGDHRALAIDPTIDIALYTGVAKLYKSKLIGAVDTHFHDDHTSGGPLLAHRVGGTYFSPHVIQKLSYNLIGSVFTIHLKRLILRMVPTPGHTPESVTLLAAHVAFTGDTLLIDGFATPYHREPRISAEQLWETLHNRLFHLDTMTTILPAHTKPEDIQHNRPVCIQLGILKKQLAQALVRPTVFVEHLVQRR